MRHPTSLCSLIKRDLSFRRVKNWYANLSKPLVSPQPPYNHITQIGDPVLRTKCEAVDPKLVSSQDIKYLIHHLKSLLKKYDCVGLAAPQVGVPLRIFVMECSPKQVKEFAKDVYTSRKMTTFPLTAFINPQIKIVDYNKISFPEACESVRGFSADVSRYAEVEVKDLQQPLCTKSNIMDEH